MLYNRSLIKILLKDCGMWRFRPGLAGMRDAGQRPAAARAFVMSLPYFVFLPWSCTHPLFTTLVAIKEATAPPMVAVSACSGKILPYT